MASRNPLTLASRLPDLLSARSSRAVAATPKAKHSKMVTLLNYRLKVTLNDGRSLVGQMLAYDKHMNFVLAECEEFRTVKGKKAKNAAADESAPTVQQKRTLGLVILRGETIVSVTVEGPPPVTAEDKAGILAGPGKGVPAGRGMPLGAGAPGAMAARPMAYARPPPGFPPGMPGLPQGMPPGFPGGLPPGMPPQAGMPPGFRPPGFPGGPPGMPFPPGQMPPGFPTRPPGPQ
ncbi:hypothetical protein EHS25_008787 [Saitozyma podzolica]|uniref:Sm protein B n=1 Tax=Saitozyma podzolica TaxID=1890683 RepID=A0A427YMM0_9TREE|nr:hypothetical protein EHS25_008787 [Saitozyma podzolica]